MLSFTCFTFGIEPVHREDSPSGLPTSCAAIVTADSFSCAPAYYGNEQAWPIHVHPSTKPHHIAPWSSIAMENVILDDSPLAEYLEGMPLPRPLIPGS